MLALQVDGSPERAARMARVLLAIYLIAALPVAGNVYMLAQHYNVAPTRVSTAILVSTAGSILTVSLVVGWVSAF